MQEEWRVVEGFDGKYKVSSLGRVWNIFTDKEVAQVLSGIPQYKYVNLRNPVTKERKQVRVHRIVAEAFIDNPENHPIVDHIDRDKFNNTLNNLRWANTKENSRNKNENIFIKEMYAKDYVKKYEKPNNAYVYLLSALGSGLTEQQAIDKYDLFLRLRNKKAMVMWDGREQYLQDVCLEFNKDYKSVKGRIMMGYPVWNALMNVPVGVYTSFQLNGAVCHWYPSKEYFRLRHGRSVETLTKLINLGYTYEQILKYAGVENIRSV